MTIIDLQSFLQERIQVFDETIDIGPGSKADTQIIQPVLRRLGPDPFTVDIRAFILDRLNQEFPEFATTDGDALTDLLIKPIELLFDPMVREHQRVRANLSFRDPTILTLDEAETLGSNYFVSLETGNVSKGQVRIYYPSPQSTRVTPANFVMSRSGLTFFPDGIQSIRVEEMLFNVEGSLYYFDVNVVAEQAGDQYNIEADEIVSIANLAAAVRVTNKRRFRDGVAAEDTSTYVGRIERGTTDRTLVTKRGIVSQVSNSFPELTRLNVVGMNDPEMQRDIVKGGGLGGIIQAGVAGEAIADGDNLLLTRRFTFNPSDGPIDFMALMGPPGVDMSQWRLILHGAWLGLPPARDIVIRSVVNSTTLELAEQVIPITQTGIVWELRKNSITLSDIPGGILFPDGPNGTVSVPDGQIHVGGATDTYLRGTVFDTGSLAISNITDDSPLLSGVEASSAGGTQVTLADLLMAPAIGATYVSGDATYRTLADLPTSNVALQILTGPGAGIYTIESVTQVPGASPIITIVETVPVFSPVRWRIVDVIDIDLNEPKETRISGIDLNTLQGSNIVDTGSNVSFADFGVVQNDTLRILSGPDAGDFNIVSVTPFPSYTKLVLDRALSTTGASLRYTVFKASSPGGVQLPFIRMTSIDLLDSNLQPIGSKIPYAKPIGAYSRAFSNPAHGVKISLDDAILGIVGISTGGSANVNGKILQVKVGVTTYTITFVGANPIPLATIISQINAAVGQTIATVVDTDKLGIFPIIPTAVSIVGGTNIGTSALPALFGGMTYLTDSMVRSPTFDSFANYFSTEVVPPLDLTYDVLQVIDGTQIGYYGIDFAYPYPGVTVTPPVGLTAPNFLSIHGLGFFPQNRIRFQVGSRSFGSARVYFLEPTTVEFSPSTRFLAALDNGSTLRFLPDPTNDAQLVPPLPGGVKPKDGTTGPGVTTMTSLSSDFIKKRIKPGDVLQIDFIPVKGTVILADPIVTLAFKTLIISLAGGPDLTITFVRDNTLIPATDVSRQGVANEINSAVGQSIASIDGTNHLVLNPTVALTIRKTGTANALLGFSTVSDQSNQAKHTGRYTITTVSTTSLGFTPPTPNDLTTENNEQFTIVRPGTQRVGATQMALNKAEAGLYYADVELVSEGTGDVYNIEADQSLFPDGYGADGYYLTTDNPVLSFSGVEKLHLRLSRTINEVGTDDDPSVATQLLGQNIQLSYDLSTLTGDVQGFLSSDLERVVCASPLARHLTPHFIRLDCFYTGGPKETEVQPDVETLINALFPDQQLQVSAIEKILSDRGATSIANPLTLFGIIYNVDRSVTLEKSQDRINVGRLAAFIPERVNLTRSLT